MKIGARSLWVGASLAWLAHLWFTATHPMSIDGMDAFYLVFIKNMAAGRGLTYDGVSPGAHLGPLFIMAAAAFERVFGGGVESIKWLNFFFDAASFFLVVWTARRLFGPAVAAWSGLLLAWYPGYWNFDLQVRVENMNTAASCLALAAGALFVEKPSGARAWGSGLAVGLTSLVKAVSVPAVPLAAALLYMRGLRKEAALFVLGFALALAPWIARNAVQLHRFIPMQGAAWPQLIFASDPDFCSGFPLTPQQGIELYDRIGAPGPEFLFNVNNDAYWKQKGLAALRAHPFVYLFGIPRRAVTLWIGNRYYLVGGLSDDVAERGVAVVVIGILKRLLVVPAILGLAFLTTNRLKTDPRVLMLGVLPAAITLTYSLAYTEAGRYQLQALPALMILAAVALDRVMGEETA